MVFNKPVSSECGEYYWKYINLVPEGDLVEFLQNQKESVLDYLGRLDIAKNNFAYAEGKWTVNQVIIHCLDAERVFAYRALALSRGEQKPIPGFEQDDYVNALDVTHRTFKDLMWEFETIRDATISLFSAISPEQALRKGIVSENSMSVRAIAYIIAGHFQHHLNILKSRY